MYDKSLLDQATWTHDEQVHRRIYMSLRLNILTYFLQ